MWISFYPFSPWQIDLETFSFKSGKGIRWVHMQQMGIMEKASDLINFQKNFTWLAGGKVSLLWMLVPPKLMLLWEFTSTEIKALFIDLCEHWRWRHQSLKLCQHLSNELMFFLAKIQYSLNENPWFTFLNYSCGGIKLMSSYCLWSHQRNKQKRKNMPSKQQPLENTDLILVATVENACPSLMQPQNILALQVGCLTASFQSIARPASWISQQLFPGLCLHLFPLLLK